MAHEWNRRVWFVRGVDSYNQDDDIWCRHYPDKPLHKIYKHGEVSYHQCLNCGRQFQDIHPITAEEIIRGKDLEIRRLMEMIQNV